jgi:hypothetical protein
VGRFHPRIGGQAKWKLKVTPSFPAAWLTKRTPRTYRFHVEGGAFIYGLF